MPAMPTSRTQYEILRLFAKGKSDREIAAHTAQEIRGVTRTIAELCSGDPKVGDGSEPWSYHSSVPEDELFAATQATLTAAGDPDAAEQVERLEHKVSLLAELAAEILTAFWQKGHPGEPCRRSGWVKERTIAGWRKRLDALSMVGVPPDDPPST